MRVYEVAKELNVSSDTLVYLLRAIDIPVRSHMTPLGDEHVARVRGLLERERGHGHHSNEAVLEALIREASAGPRRRRRREEFSDPVENVQEVEAPGPSTNAHPTISPTTEPSTRVLTGRNMPAAFLSYVHSDDNHGHISELRDHLSYEVQIQTGEDFSIFQDRNEIRWGQNWKERIEESLDEVTFLIPILTPGFFNSSYCRKEIERFLEREKQLRRSDLIFPVYYVGTPLLENEKRRANDPLAEVIAGRQYADWRELRFEPLTSPQVRRKLAHLAVQIRDAVEHRR